MRDPLGHGSVRRSWEFPIEIASIERGQACPGQHGRQIDGRDDDQRSPDITQISRMNEFREGNRSLILVPMAPSEKQRRRADAALQDEDRNAQVLPGAYIGGTRNLDVGGLSA